MTATLCASLQRLHQLTWQAGEWMDEGWWSALSLQPWQLSYQQYPATRPALNRLIAGRLGIAQAPLPGQLTAQQQQLMALEPRLQHLCTALGLLAIACPDYLLLGRYRRQLGLQLGNRACDQLLALGVFDSTQPAILPAEQLLAGASERGIAWLRASAENCLVCRALQIILPPGSPAAVPALGSAVPWLLRIGRFL